MEYMEYSWDKSVEFTIDKKELMTQKELIEFEKFLIDNYNLDDENYIIDIHQISTNLIPYKKFPKDCLLIQCRFRDKRTSKNVVDVLSKLKERDEK